VVFVRRIWLAYRREQQSRSTTIKEPDWFYTQVRSYKHVGRLGRILTVVYQSEQMKRARRKNSNRKNASKRMTVGRLLPRSQSDEEHPIVDNDELDFTIHQQRVYGQPAEPLTVRAIIDGIEKLRHSSTATLTDAERDFLTDFIAVEGRGAFIETWFLHAAVENGRTLKTCTTYFDDDKEREDNDAHKEREPSGWFGLHRFFDMYVVNWTQYGEGQDEYGSLCQKERR
jgi:hypothetical protein